LIKDIVRIAYDKRINIYNFRRSNLLRLFFLARLQKQKRNKKTRKVKSNKMEIEYFKRNPIDYALALEGNGFDDKKIQYALEISKWYPKEIIVLTMQQLVKGRKEENDRKKHLSKS